VNAILRLRELTDDLARQQRILDDLKRAGHTSVATQNVALRIVSVPVSGLGAAPWPNMHIAEPKRSHAAGRFPITPIQAATKVHRRLNVSLFSDCVGPGSCLRLTNRRGASSWTFVMREKFDGVFANASLFHVPSQGLPRVLRKLHTTLKPRGALFSPNPRGSNEEGWNHGRYAGPASPVASTIPRLFLK